jgi:hypothetical protein
MTDGESQPVGTELLLQESLRMRQCPGIYFADEASGRTAKVRPSRS